MNPLIDNLKPEDMSRGVFIRKISLFLAIFLLYTLFFILIGAKYGYDKGVNVAVDYYDNFYIEKYCYCENRPKYLSENFLDTFKIDVDILNKTT